MDIRGLLLLYLLFSLIPACGYVVEHKLRVWPVWQDPTATSLLFPTNFYEESIIWNITLGWENFFQ